jgi:uncharacterized protein (DUF1330 family)
MPKAYWVAHVRVDNPDPYAAYAAGATEAFKRYGGRPLARGGRVVSLEGEERPRNVVIEFDDIDAALRCYNSAEYQSAKLNRDGHADADLMIIEGVA